MPNVFCTLRCCYWVCSQKTRWNLVNLLWLVSTSNYNRDVIMVAQDSRLLSIFKIIITISFTLIRRRIFWVMALSWQFLVFQDTFKTSARSLRRLRRWKILRLKKQEVVILKMSSRRLEDQKIFSWAFIRYWKHLCHYFLDLLWLNCVLSNHEDVTVIYMICHDLNLSY